MKIRVDKSVYPGCPSVVSSEVRVSVDDGGKYGSHCARMARGKRSGCMGNWRLSTVPGSKGPCQGEMTASQLSHSIAPRRACRETSFALQPKTEEHTGSNCSRGIRGEVFGFGGGEGEMILGVLGKQKGKEDLNEGGRTVHIPPGGISPLEHPWEREVSRTR